MPSERPASTSEGEKREMAGAKKTGPKMSMRPGLGSVCVSVVFVLLVLSWIASRYSTSLVDVRDILLAGFIGGFTNTVAIRMLFSKYWFLPGSGVLLKKKDSIVRSLANTVEAHIINPELIEEKIRQVLKELDLDKERTAKAFNMVIDEVRQPLLSYVTSQQMKKRFMAALEREGGVLGEIANFFGVIEYDKLADTFRDRLAERIQEFTIDAKMVEAVVERMGSMEDFLLKPDNEFVRRHYNTDKSIALLVFEGLDVKQLVIDKLSQYKAEKIRDIVEGNIREHLAWLEVFGVILGMAFAGGVKGADALIRVVF